MVRRTVREIREAILKYLRSVDHPRTTEDVADAVDMNWRSADLHLRVLLAEKKVFMKKIGRQCQWFTDDVSHMRDVLEALERKGVVIKVDGRYVVKR